MKICFYSFSSVIIIFALFANGCSAISGEKQESSIKAVSHTKTTSKTEPVKELTLQEVLAKSTDQISKRNGFTYNVDGYLKTKLQNGNRSDGGKSEYRLKVDFTQKPLVYHSTGHISYSKKKLPAELYIANNYIYSKSKANNWHKSKQLTKADELSIPTISLQEINQWWTEKKTEEESKSITMSKDGESYIIKVNGGFLSENLSYREAFTEQVLNAVSADIKQLQKLGVKPDTKKMQFMEFTQVYKINQKTFLLEEYNEIIQVKIPANQKYVFYVESNFKMPFTDSFQGAISLPPGIKK